MADSKKPREGLALIATDWFVVTDPAQFVHRYAPAIHGYLQSLLRNKADVDEVMQEFLLSVVQRGFAPERVRTGRFRDYLIAAVRNQAFSYLRRKRPKPLSDEEAGRLPARDNNEEWLAGWRGCLLDRAWEALESKQRHSLGNWHYTALRLATDHPEAESQQLAARVPADPPLSVEAFRKQLSRARAAFAQALVHEAQRTIENPTAAAVVDELAELGLLEYVRPYLRGGEPRVR